MVLGVASIFVLNPGIRIFLESLGDRILQRTMVEKNGESTPRLVGGGGGGGPR